VVFLPEHILQNSNDLGLNTAAISSCTAHKPIHQIVVYVVDYELGRRDLHSQMVLSALDGLQKAKATRC
jgi:hypothetical protein